MVGNMTARASIWALAGLVGVLVVGCENDSERASTTEAATTKTTQTDTAVAPPGLGRYLLRADEGPRLEPLSPPQTDLGEPFDLPEEAVATLRRSGYISTTYQTGQGDSSAGVSSVLLFETAAGARAWMAYETSDDALRHQIPNGKFEPFLVPDVPGAHGWTGPDLHGNAIGNVYWTQGRCMMVISLETGGPRVEPLSAGAKAIYKRTGGSCPE
jgi:hypothetical protein